MDNNKKIGQRINSALAARNKRQKDLAHHLDVTDNTISYFCGGKRTPNISQLIKISEFLDVSTDYLLGKDVPMTADISVQEFASQTGLSEENILRLIAWNNLQHTMSTNNEDSPEYISRICELSENFSVITKPEDLSKIVLEFANILLSSYLNSPGMPTRSYKNYMFSLYTWYKALQGNSEHEIYTKSYEIDSQINEYGLITLTAEESAQLSLKRIFDMLADEMERISKKIIFEEIDE